MVVMAMDFISNLIKSDSGKSNILIMVYIFSKNSITCTCLKAQFFAEKERLRVFKEVVKKIWIMLLTSGI